MYKCRRCRTTLVDSEDVIIPHSPGKGQQAFKRSKRSATATVVCSSIFLEGPLDWMGDVSEQEGKLECPKSYRVVEVVWRSVLLRILQARVDRTAEISTVLPRMSMPVKFESSRAEASSTSSSSAIAHPTS